MDVVQNFQRMYTLSQNKLEALRELVKQMFGQEGEKLLFLLSF